MKYQDLIQTPQEESQLEFTVANARLQAEADLLALRQQISNLRADLQKALSSTTFSLTACAEIKYNITRLEEVITIAETLKTELF